MSLHQQASELRTTDPRGLLDHCQDYLSNKPEDYLVFIECAFAAETLGDADAAEKFYKQAFDVHNNDHIFITYINFLLRQGNREMADLYYYQALNCCGLTTPLAALSRKLGSVSIKKAVSFFQESLTEFSSLEDAYNFAIALSINDQLDEAFHLVDSLDDIDPIHLSRYKFGVLVKSGKLSTTNHLPMRSEPLDNNFSHSTLTQSLFQYWDKDSPPLDVVNLFELNKKATNGNYYIGNKNSFLENVSDYFTPSSARLIIDYCQHPSAQSDLYRWTELLIRGGIYLDADMQLSHQSFFNNLDPISVIFPWANELKYPCICNWIIKTEPALPLLEMTLVAIEKLIRDCPQRVEHLTMFDVTGPGILTHAFIETYLETGSSDYVFIDETSFHSAFMYGSNLAYKKSADTYWPLIANPNHAYVSGETDA